MNQSPAPDSAPTPSSPLATVARFRGLVALVVAGSFIRLSDLTEWWLNPDEGIYYSILTRAGFGGFWQEVTANAHPPLYYLILRGMGVLTWDFFWFRVLSVVCGVVAMVGAWAVARRLAGGGARGEVAGLTAALVLALAPGTVALSQVMRPYMLQLALLSWALFFLVRYRSSDSARDRGAYLTLLVLALLTHYSSVLALGVFLLAVAVQGIERGLEDDAWKKLAVAHAVPLAVVGLLYLFHVRPLAATALADDALDGWLSFYMIDAPGDAWWSFLGFMHLLAGPWLRGPMALLVLAALGLAVAQDRRDLVVLVGGGMLVAIVAAAAGLYPLGSTRHSAWLLAFVVPVLGWVTTQAVDVPPDRSRIAWFGALLVLLALGRPVGALLGTERAPWAPADRVLRQDDLGTVVDVLDPSGDPELVVMSSQTFYLLTPFYPLEREAAVFSPDSSAFHFPYGDRQILVSTAWDFTLDEGGAGPTPPSSLPRDPNSDGPAPSGDFLDFLRAADRAFPRLGLDSRERALVLVGGWRPGFVDRLAARPGATLERGVPGLRSFIVDLAAMASSDD